MKRSAMEAITWKHVLEEASIEDLRYENAL
jgi:hypothetical protein